MDSTFPRTLLHNFLGDSPTWYKLTILSFLIINPLSLWLLPEGVGGTVMGWLLLGEFILTLAMALKCYPLLPGGLLALQAVALGLTSPDAVMAEVEHNLAVILLLMFMVAGIHFMKDLLLFIFTKLLVKVRSKYYLSFLFCVVSAVLSAFLDALTVTAVLIAVAVGFYRVYYRVAGEIAVDEVVDLKADSDVDDEDREELQRFRAFLRSLLMHSLVGTALGGVATMVGEPQNLLIAKQAGWGFIEFMVNMAGVSVPVIVAGLLTCLTLEKLKWFGYGTMMPKPVQAILREYDNELSSLRDARSRLALWSQAVIAVCLVVSLAMHVAEVGLIGLALIVLLTSLNGINHEHQIGEAFEEALPFTALLVVFFAVVSVIHSQHLFSPFVALVLAQPLEAQTGILYLANGLLSVISDNVFVATVYIGEMKNALLAGEISEAQFQQMAVAINAGTNLPSVATPNGQAAFLFLLTSAIAPLIRLSYGRMVWMALPYTVVLSIVGYLGVTLG